MGHEAHACAITPARRREAQPSVAGEGMLDVPDLLVGGYLASSFRLVDKCKCALPRQAGKRMRRQHGPRPIEALQRAAEHAEVS